MPETSAACAVVRASTPTTVASRARAHPAGAVTIGPVRNARQVDEATIGKVFAGGVAFLVVYNVVRGLGWFGPFGDASALLIVLVFAALAWRARFTSSELGLARSDLGRGFAYGGVTVLIVA